MNTKPNLSVRKSRPQSLGGAFGGLLRLIGGRASDADLSMRWGQIVGSGISSQANLVGLSRGKTGRTITVRATNPAAALALSYQKDEIISDVNKYFGYDAVAKVVIKK
ncbi:MAG: DUF721 domain-containing protein [Alphaproteobacteria bacterium]|nr:DUF721 domain-containing protein [Alphaproteobacteria bacterium]MCL2890086.1 DUF721 domain-containing protein [Alphaproteobacteria bacterium]